MALPANVEVIAAGLWRWTADHPDWRPGAQLGSSSDWEQQVGSVLYQTDRACVFFDPLAPGVTRSDPLVPGPPDSGAPGSGLPDHGFWSWADGLVDGRAAYVLNTLKWHRRSRELFVDRYGALTSRAKRNLPAGVESFVVPDGGETMYWLPGPRALISGDRILGAPGGGLRLCPDSWLRYLPSKLTRAGLAQRLRPLLELPIEQVLVSHGAPVLSGGREALARAIAPERR